MDGIDDDREHVQIEDVQARIPRAPAVLAHEKPPPPIAGQLGGSQVKKRATGARRMSEPLPALFGAVEPAYGSRVRSKRSRAARTVLPMSKQRPVLLK